MRSCRRSTPAVAVPDELRAGAVPPTEEELRSWQELDPGPAVLAADGARPLDARAAEEFYLRTLRRPCRRRERDLEGGSPILRRPSCRSSPRPTSRSGSRPARTWRRSPPPSSASLREAAPEAAEVEIERRLDLAGGSDPARRARGPARPGRVRARRRPAAAAASLRRHDPARACAGRARHPDDPLGLRRCPGANIHSPNERLLARYVPLGVEAARETLVALAGLPR